MRNQNPKQDLERAVIIATGLITAFCITYLVAM
jgi:hypothetical protein